MVQPVSSCSLGAGCSSVSGIISTVSADVNRTTTMLTLQNTHRRTAYMSGQLGTKKAKKQEYGQETFASFLAVSQERRLQVEKLSLF